MKRLGRLGLVIAALVALAGARARAGEVLPLAQGWRVALETGSWSHQRDDTGRGLRKRLMRD